MEDSNQEHETATVTETHHHHKKSKVPTIILAILAVVILAIAGTGIWLYTGKPSAAKEKVFKALPFPVALVDSTPVSQSEYFKRLEAAKSFYKTNSQPEPGDLKQQVLDNLIAEQKLKMLAKQRGIQVNSREVDEQYNSMVKDLAGGDENKLDEMITQYGLNREQFKQQIIYNDLIRAQLAVWFGNQRNLNETAYKTMDEVQKQINEGKSLESLASQYSQDQASSQMEGDVGFVEENQLLPEFQKGLDSIAEGKVGLVVSRFGLHMLKVVGKDNQGTNGASRVHLKQIFIKTEDPTAWYNSESDKIKVRQLIKL